VEIEAEISVAVVLQGQTQWNSAPHQQNQDDD